MNRNRIIYGLLTICILLIGLASRRFFVENAFVKLYIGDVLWALMVFFGIAFLSNRWSTKMVAVAALLFSFAIEISQLYQAPWINDLRATRLGGLVLGFTFVWSDLLCYYVGVFIGVLVDTYLMPARYKHLSKYIRPGTKLHGLIFL